ncbi:NAD-dependent epimerase/dehydratase family protein [Paenibacillus timonensis]|uniref:NAD-dependent epimerase/dehydratase family protein n=1 Tax=Paenibacillus TaxID=44249 RepID=UPI000F9B3AEB|nr:MULTISPECIES: NAD-dependent epimerase/dehydratase family protein [Paenibacillus]MUG87821.1 NAD-dependent epimerase/dehydratase family protein [Paenibacillus timonensis]GIP50735.1 UDP-glucose 4-epimerase [Paenibacillus sp. J53TS2]
MKVLVTGGAGFIGRHTVKRLLEEGEQVVVVDTGQTGNPRKMDESVSYYSVDIVSEELESIFAEERPDAVIHLAAQTSVRRSLQNPSADAETNILGTIQLLQQCVRFGVRRIVFASSAAVYGNPDHLPIKESHGTEPLSFYGVSKRVSEMYIQSFSERYGLDYSILRYANVYGIRERRTGEDGVLTAFVERLMAGLPLEVYGDGLQTRDFVYVKDVAEANVLALRSSGNQILNVSSGRSISLLEALGMLKEISGRNVQPQFRPAQAGDIEQSLLDNGKVRDVLWWEPRYSLYDGLLEMMEFETEARKNPLLVERVGYSETSVI